MLEGKSKRKIKTRTRNKVKKILSYADLHTSIRMQIWAKLSSRVPGRGKQSQSDTA
jgi:hypothetical protein